MYHRLFLNHKSFGPGLIHEDTAQCTDAPTLDPVGLEEAEKELQALQGERKRPHSVTSMEDDDKNERPPGQKPCNATTRHRSQQVR